jgi:hypothetical protein
MVSRVAQSVQCLATGCTTRRSRFDPRQRREDFSPGLCVQTGSGSHPVPCTMGTGNSFSGAKARSGHDADHSPLSSAEVKNEWELYYLSPQAPSWRVGGLLWLFTLDNIRKLRLMLKALFALCGRVNSLLGSLQLQVRIKV